MHSKYDTVSAEVKSEALGFPVPLAPTRFSISGLRRPRCCESLLQYLLLLMLHVLPFRHAVVNPNLCGIATATYLLSYLRTDLPTF